jgi:hypothetical protein
MQLAASDCRDMETHLHPFFFDSISEGENDIGGRRIREDLPVGDEGVRIDESTGRLKNKFEYEQRPQHAHRGNVNLS